ncbi:mitochondrial carrier domain-containing protein [Radiomyces spectabilis]|uniref:mitochondrial carrier domain-containing protein n=1 Tax=Radiomyces spectabilis TaxID=64574 RepID=UPI002220C1A4|nr:mitochondrial carrier domain-containing protein [Radiomyces spectabilis]KAI8366812.1 mitochondrial carrier domain-containing protein [Radiomyces spectabilis]
MDEEYDYESLGNNSSMAQNAMAGALAGIAEHCVMYPVDSIKTRMQVIQNSRPATVPPLSSYPTGVGLRTASRNLWRGVNSVVLGAGPAHALHFATYEYCKEYLGANQRGHHPFASAIAGACATLAHDTLMNPFDVVKQRMQLRESTYRSVRECARQVFAKEGVTAFYISLPTTLAMSIPFQSVQFATYEFFRKVLNPKGEYDPKTHVIAGGLAGAMASSITTPLDVIKTVLQTRGSSNDLRVRNATGLLDAMSIIRERYGLRGFFRGFRPRVLTHMPSAAISWSVYEYFKWFMDARPATQQQQQDKNSLLL